MSGEVGPNRILVISGPTRVDTQELAGAAHRLSTVASRLALLVAHCASALESVEYGARLAPEGGYAVFSVEKVRSEVLRSSEIVAALADRVSFSAALYEDAELLAAAVSGRCEDTGGADFFESFKAFFAGSAGTDALGRTQRAIAKLSALLEGNTSGRSASSRAGVSGAGNAATIEAARKSAALWELFGVYLEGNVSGIEIRAGRGLAPGQHYRFIQAGSSHGSSVGGIAGRLHEKYPVLVGFLGRARYLVEGMSPLGIPLSLTHSFNSYRSERDIAQEMSEPRPIRSRPTPLAPSALLTELSDIGGHTQAGQLKILRHDTPLPDGTSTTSWTIVVRGTQRWMPGVDNPQDMATNLEEVAGLRSDQSRAILEAMDMAGIKAGEPVEFVGHSQGGIVAARLATDPAVLADYSVVSVLTAGSPIAASLPPESVKVLALENTRDIVPALDGANNAKDVVTVLFDGEETGGESSSGVPKAHDVSTYRALLESIETPNPHPSVVSGAEDPRVCDDDPGLAQVREWEYSRIQSLGFTDKTRTSEIVFDTRRIRSRM